MSHDSDIALDGRAMREERRERHARNREAADPAGWRQHTPDHWSRELLGSRLDYWPGSTRFRWRGVTRVGGVQGFIRKQEASHDHR